MSFSSPTVSFEGLWCEPRPIQRGGIPSASAGARWTRPPSASPSSATGGSPWASARTTSSARDRADPRRVPGRRPRPRRPSAVRAGVAVATPRRWPPRPRPHLRGRRRARGARRDPRVRSRSAGSSGTCRRCAPFCATWARAFCSRAAPTLDRCPRPRALALLAASRLLSHCRRPGAATTSSASSTLHWTSCDRTFQCAAPPRPARRQPAHRADHQPRPRPAPGEGPGQAPRLAARQPGGPGCLRRAVRRAERDDAARRDPCPVRHRRRWDPRGVGGSAPVSCASNLDSYYDLDFAPADRVERQRSTPACRRSSTSARRRTLPTCPTCRASAPPGTSTGSGPRSATRAAYPGSRTGPDLGVAVRDRFPTHIARWSSTARSIRR